MGLLDWFHKKRGTQLSDIPGTDNLLRRLNFMAWTGNDCHDGFCADLSDFGNIEQAYEKCSTLSTVINRNAMAMANGRWWIVDDQDNNVEGRYPSLEKIFKQPNPLHTFSEFIMQFDVFRQLYGETFAYSVAPVGFGNDESSALWAIHPRYIEIELTRRIYMQSSINGIVENYYLLVDGRREKLDKDRILHIKDVNQNLSFCQTNIRGKSRLSGLESTIRNIVMAEEAIYSMNRDRGAMGIISNDSKDKLGSIPLTPEEKQEFHQQYQRDYGLIRGQWKTIFTDLSLKYSPMSFNTKDLMLHEGLEKNMQILSSAFGYPYSLLGVSNNSNINSVTGRYSSEEKKQHYQDTVIPIAKIYQEKFSEFFGLGKDQILIDFSEVESLKTAETEAADTLYKKNQALHEAYQSGVISREEYRLGLGYDEEIYGTTMYSNGNEDQQDGNQEDQTAEGEDTEG